MYRSVPLCGTLQIPFISNKHCDLNLRTYHCSGGYRYRDVGGGGGQCGKQNLLNTGPWKPATIPLYNLLKSPVGAHVHKTNIWMDL
jgi:hypothetical protein